MTSAELAIPLQGVTGSGDVRSKCIFLPQNKKKVENILASLAIVFDDHIKPAFILLPIYHQPEITNRALSDDSKVEAENATTLYEK